MDGSFLDMQQYRPLTQKRTVGLTFYPLVNLSQFSLQNSYNSFALQIKTFFDATSLRPYPFTTPPKPSDYFCHE